MRGTRTKCVAASNAAVFGLSLAAAMSILSAPLDAAHLVEGPPALAATVGTAASTAVHPPVATEATAPPTAAALAAAKPKRVKAPPSAIRQYATKVSDRLNLPPGVRVTQNQVIGVAEAICDGFDKGYSYAQVHEGLKSAGSKYSLGVSDDDAAYAIREAVNIRCPAHVGVLPSRWQHESRHRRPGGMHD